MRLPGRRDRVSRRVHCVLAVLLAASQQGVAEARPKLPATGEVIYVQKGALWRARLAEPRQGTKLLPLPARWRINRLEASGDGSAVLIDLGRNAAWIDLGSEPPTPVYLPCRGRAHLSPDGERVLCASRARGDTSIYRLRPRLGASLLEGFDPAVTALADLRGERVLTAERQGLWSSLVAQPDQRTQVAPHVPSGVLSVAPDGQRAVGRYRDGTNGDSLFGFRLDGEAARRKLGPGVPVAWSADSTWLAVLDNRTACVLRAVGGEYKCWDNYRPLALDHDGSWLLLAKPPTGKGRLDLFLGRIGGPKTERPLRLLRGVVAATLVP